MIIALHKNARTTPAIRAEIAASKDSVAVLAARYGVGQRTIRRWRSREVFTDASHTAHRLQTTLTPAQDAVVVELRKCLLLPLDDLLAVCREFLCEEVSRSGLDRCLRRYKVGNLRALQPAAPQPPSKTFKAYEPGYVHVDIKYLPQIAGESARSYLFVAIDRATRWVFVQIRPDKSAASARAFLAALHDACPIRIVKILTDNGKEFTDRLFASREREPSGQHEFDQLCHALGIEHRLSKPRTPQTNGMVERFNGRISDVLKTHRFHSGQDMRQTLERYVHLYNHQLPQSALHSKTPSQTMNDWYLQKPELFHRKPQPNRPGRDNYESRLVDLGLDDETKKWMDEEVDALFEDVEMSKSEQLKAEFSQKEAIVGNRERVKLIVKDIIEHFEKREEVFAGKGMIVAMSRAIAASLYEEIVALRPAWHSDEVTSGVIKCVITGASSDSENLQKHIRSKPDRVIVERRFKDPKSDLKLVIVCDMWLTGFDVPPLHTMYLDKPLKMHNLMQAIARVNRIYPDKEGGLVVDYLGVAGALRDAMALYAKSGGTGTQTVDVEAAVVEMNRRVEVVRDLFHGFDYAEFFTGNAGKKLEIILDAEEFILGKVKDGEARLKREVHGLYKAFSLAMPQPDALKIREEVAFFQAVKSRLDKTSETGKLDKDYKIQLQQIVDKAIQPLGIVDVFEAAGLEKRELPMLSEEFLAEIKNYKRKSLAIRALEKLLADQIRAGFAHNAIKSEQFSELIKRALDRYKNGTIEAAKIIEELIDIARKLRADIENRPADMTDDEIAFYDALADNGSAREVLGDEQLREIARYLVEKVRKNITTDWSVRESARAQLKYEVRKALKKFGYPPDKQKLATERILLQAEVLGNLITNH